MSGNAIDLIGGRFGQLSVVGYHGSSRGGHLWLCHCDCGNSVIRKAHRLRSGISKMCNSCLAIFRAESVTTHGATREGKTQLYRIWLKMRDRCENALNPAYKYYGGKGIRRCQEWDDYCVFSDWCMKNGYSKGMSIDRIDSGRGYSPDNCRIIPTRENRVNGLKKAHANRKAAKMLRLASV